MIIPSIKPENPNFSSGPCAKRPEWSIGNLRNALLGRSHRAAECKVKLKEVISLSKSILKLPDDYLVGIMPASDTGALEAALWSLLGNRGIDILAWENFGKDWVIDIVEELKIEDVMRVADNNLTMPPKSTWFDPKPLDGLVVYEFNQEKIK